MVDFRIGNWVTAFSEKLKELRSLAPNLILCGGCALNVNLNSFLSDSNIFDKIYISPLSTDCGQSLGSILYHEASVECSYPFLGRGFGDVEELPPLLIDDLLHGKLIGWYQGRSEVGPRALGHRSILGLPSTLEMRNRLNSIKGREPYRPIAPIIPQQYLHQFFNTHTPSPYMTFAPQVADITKQKAPAVVHFDGTSRVQTIDQQDNPILHEVCIKIGELTDAPILMNSSFNLNGEAIVDTPEDALLCFARSQIDVLYLNGERFTKSDITLRGNN